MFINVPLTHFFSMKKQPLEVFWKKGVLKISYQCTVMFKKTLESVVRFILLMG